MATKVQISDQGQTVKIRNPWGVLGLTLITLGIYYLVWYYKINREMADWGGQNNVDIGTSPGVSLLAITVGALIIVPPFVSIWCTGQRMELTQRAASVDGGSGFLFFILHIIPLVSLFAPVYMQMELNKAWETLPGTVTGPEPAVAGPA
jgi:hypothetical protein